jgi:predicted CopG family antitoxin
MSGRTITVTEEAYRKLRAHKGPEESFSEVLMRLAARKPLSTFAGVLSKKSAVAFRSAIDEERRSRKRVDARHVVRH